MALRPRILEAVKQYPNLYNTEHEHYKDRVLKDKSWLEISEALNENCDFLKREWKILRDSYRQAITRRKSAKKGSRPRRWRYEKQMSFILPFMKQRLSDGVKQNYPEDPKSDKESSSDSEGPVEEYLDEEMEDPVKTEAKTFWVQSSDATSSFSTPKQTKDDDLEMFFKSLLFTSRKLPRNYQIKIKRQLLEVVSKVEEEYYSEQQM